MSVKNLKKNLLDTTTRIPSGAKILKDKEYDEEIKKRYNEDELTESARLVKQTKKIIDKS